MAEYIFPTIVLLAAFLAAWGLVLGAVGGLRLTSGLKDGLMHYCFYALFFSNGLAVLISTRNYAISGELFEQSITANPIASWAIRLTSLLIILSSADQIAKRFRKSSPPSGESIILASALVIFWLGNIAIPAIFANNSPAFQLNWFYTPIIGIGLILMPKTSGEKSMIFCRNAIIAFCTISLLLIFVKPALVLQTGYTQGYLPGVLV